MFISKLQPEDQLLMLIARRDLDLATAQSIRGLIDRHRLDWDYVSTTAALHGLAPLLANRLQSIDGAVVPPSVLSQLQTENQQSSQYCLWMTGELVKLSAAMTEAGIRYIPFKGPTLAIAAYEHLGLRPFTDLDLFVDKVDVARAKEVLSKRGFMPVRNLSRARAAALLRFDNACAFANQQDLLVDLHWAFAPRYFSLPLETDELWRRLENVNIANHELVALSAEDLIQVLCCHGFTHKWERLVWVCDIASLVARHDSLDWDYLFEKSEQLGILRIVLLGLFLASELLAAPLPSQAHARLKSDAQVRICGEEIAARLFNPDAPPSRSWLALQLRMRERVRDKFMSLLRFMLTPRDYDWMFASVPDSLAVLYYLIRPVRMARAYALRVLNRNSVST